MNIEDAVIAVLRKDRAVTAAALQAAGCERKFEGAVQRALTMWITKNGYHNLVALTEYKQCDAVLVEATSIGSSVLTIKSAIEVKFNFATQKKALATRPTSAVCQVQAYAKSLRIGSGGTYPAAMVIYIVADHASPPTAPSGTTVDRGWAYLRSRRPQASSLVLPVPVGIKSSSVRRAHLGHGDWEIGVNVWVC